MFNTVEIPIKYAYHNQVCLIPYFWFISSLASPDPKDAFGIVVSYMVKVKLYLGALGGELSAELPFILMHPKVRLKMSATRAQTI